MENPSGPFSSGAKLPLSHPFHAALPNGGIVERAHYQGTAAVNLTRPTQGHELHGLDIPRLEAHRRPCGQVQTHAVGRLAIEDQRPVNFEEMKMRPDLN